MQAPSEWLRCPGHAPTLSERWAPCPLPDSCSLPCQPPPPTLPLLPAAPFSSSMSAPRRAEAGAGTSSTWHPPGVSTAGCRMHPLPYFCNTTVLTYLQIYLCASLPQRGKAGGWCGTMKGLTWRCWALQRKKTNTDVSWSFTAPQNSPAPSSWSSTAHHSEPPPLGAAGLGFHLFQQASGTTSLLLPPSPAKYLQGSDARAKSWAPAQVRPFPPLSSHTATSFLHSSPEQYTFYSSPSKDHIYVLNSFRNQIASEWGGDPEVKKDVIQQDLLSDKGSAQNTY